MLCNNLKKMRLHRGYTQVYVQMHTGIEQSLISKFESGERLPPTESLMILADFYGTSMDYLMGRTEEVRPYPKPGGEKRR